LLLLDEPSQGLAPLIVCAVFEMIATARDTGISVLLVEQNVRPALAIADRAYLLDDGHVVYSDSARTLSKDDRLVRSLAGASARIGVRQPDNPDDSSCRWIAASLKDWLRPEHTDASFGSVA
jgi:ABC-type multidrug transport system ATPase subunit